MYVLSVENHFLNTCRYRSTTGNQISLHCNEIHFLIFEHFGMFDFLGVIKKPMSELNDTTEEDRAAPDDLAEGNDSSSGEEQVGNSMTEEVK